MKPEQAVRTLLGPAADQVWKTGRKQVVRIAARRSGRERRWKMRLVEDAAGLPKVLESVDTRSKFIVWLVSLWAPRFFCNIRV